MPEPGSARQRVGRRRSQTQFCGRRHADHVRASAHLFRVGSDAGGVDGRLLFEHFAWLQAARELLLDVDAPGKP